MPQYNNIQIRERGYYEPQYLPQSEDCGVNHWNNDQKSKEKQACIQKEIRIRDLLDVWQDANSIRLKAASVSRYQNIIDTHILPDIGDLNVAAITTGFLNKYIGAKLQNGRIDGTGGLSPAYVRSIALIINAAIKFGAAEQLCEPLKSPLTKPSPGKKEIVVLSKEDQARLETSLRSQITEEKLLTYIALYTGMRIGEVLALKWEDVDWTDQILHVRHTISRVWQTTNGTKHSMLIEEKPKTKTSQRVIPLCSKLYDVLVSFPDKKSSGYILSSKGTFVSPRTFEYRYKRILEECGLVPMNFHILRHTFATRCVEANVDIKSLSEILGHANTSITLNAYVHSSLELKRRQLEKIV